MGSEKIIQAIKAVEIGSGYRNATRFGSEVHDPIVPAEEKKRTGGFGRTSNRAGGLEGGVTTGGPVVVRGRQWMN